MKRLKLAPVHRIARKGARIGVKPRKRRKSGELTKLKRSLWDLCREFTRKRWGNECWTCFRKDLNGSNWQTGHMITSSVCSIPMRYDLRNLRPQCYHCNINLSGNWPNFVERYELDGFSYKELLKENIEGKGKVYPKEWFENKIAEYQKLLSV